MSTRMGESRTKGEKSEVQGDLQIPSSLVALAPCLPGRCSDIYLYIQSPSWRDCARQKDDLRLFLCRSSPKKKLLYVCTHYADTPAFSPVRLNLPLMPRLTTILTLLHIGRDIVKELYDSPEFFHR